MKNIKKDVSLLGENVHTLEKEFCLMEEDFAAVNKYLDDVQSVTENIDNLS